MHKHALRTILLASLLAALAGLSAYAVSAGTAAADPPAHAAHSARLAPAAAATDAPDGVRTHVVRRGETLSSIGRRYGVSVRDLAAYNNISNPDRIWVGQVLRIPPAGRPTVTPPRPTPTPPLPCPCEEIVIQQPARGATITNPVTVSGVAASSFEQTVVVAVLDGAGAQIGLAPAIITGEMGQRGPFSVSVPFTPPTNSQVGRIQVFTESPRDGALEHLSSVSVMLTGLDLDALLTNLETALKAKDYAGLQALMAPQFTFAFYGAEQVTLSTGAAAQQLALFWLTAGTPAPDFSVDAKALLAGRATLEPKVIHVVYSRGWGPQQNDDAFLLIGNVDGQARWTGILYAKHDQIDYR